MTSFPHSLVLDSHNLNLNFLINWPIFMKIVAKCSDFVSLSYQVQEKVCYPILLIANAFIFCFSLLH